MAILANTQYSEIAEDTTLTAIEGKQYIIRNTDTETHTITYGSDTFDVEASAVVKFVYANSLWISDYANSYCVDNFEAIEITTDTTLTAVEGKQFLVKNTDTTTHTITYDTDTTTIQQDYTGIFYYVNSAWVYIGAFDKDGNTVIGGNLSALGTISGASETPALYNFYDQEPMESAPADLYTGTTWENVSERSIFYHLALTSGGTETNVVTRDSVEHNDGSDNWSIDKEYSFADLIYDDVIGGTGTYSGYYVIEVDNFSGMHKRYEGGYANDFEGGTLAHASQRATGFFQVNRFFNLETQTDSGILYYDDTVTSEVSPPDGASGTANYNLSLDTAGQTGQTYNTSGDGDGNEGSDPGENRVDSYTIRKWRRVS